MAAAAAAGIKGVAAGITAAVRRLSAADGGGGPLLVLENPDFLLAATEGVGALDMADLVLDLREVCGWLAGSWGQGADAADSCATPRSCS